MMEVPNMAMAVETSSDTVPPVATPVKRRAVFRLGTSPVGTPRRKTDLKFIGQRQRTTEVEKGRRVIAFPLRGAGLQQ